MMNNLMIIALVMSLVFNPYFSHEILYLVLYILILSALKCLDIILTFFLIVVFRNT